MSMHIIGLESERPRSWPYRHHIHYIVDPISKNLHAKKYGNILKTIIEEVACMKSMARSAGLSRRSQT